MPAVEAVKEPSEKLSIRVGDALGSAQEHGRVVHELVREAVGEHLEHFFGLVAVMQVPHRPMELRVAQEVRAVAQRLNGGNRVAQTQPLDEVRNAHADDGFSLHDRGLTALQTLSDDFAEVVDRIDVDVVEPLDITIWDDDMVLVKITGIGEDFEGDTGYLLSIENRSDTDFVVTNLTTTLDGEDVWYDATFYGPCLAGQSTEAFFYFDADNVGTITSSSNVEFDLGLVDANEDVVGFTSVSMPQ